MYKTQSLANTRINVANIITGIRMVCSIALLFCAVFSPAFYTLYIIAGVSDMTDGWLARRTNSVSEFGSKFDFVADFIFVAVCLVKLVPVMDIPLWIFVWTGIIACIKFFNMGCVFAKNKQLLAVHNVLNKFTGFLLFLFPLTWPLVDMKYGAAVVCLVATIAAIIENAKISVRMPNGNISSTFG